MVTAREFHDETAHTPDSVRRSTHGLDWDIKPFPYKLYPDLEVVPLPREVSPLAVDTLRALGAEAEPPRPLTLETLAAILYYSAGVTRTKTYPGGGEVAFRAAASTGALFQTEVYVVAGEVEDLAPGVYHFCPGDLALRCVRPGDVRAAVADAAGEPALTRRAATVALTAIVWRNTWKYQARGFRHLYWDAGTMLANLLAVADAAAAVPRLLTGFVDTAVDHLLGVDGRREPSLALVALGPEGPPAAQPGTLDRVAHAVVPLSAREVDYPRLREMQAASSLSSAEAVRGWRSRVAAGAPSRAALAPVPTPAGPMITLPPPRETAGRGLGDTIQHRGSTRRFSHAPIGAGDLATALWAATRPVPADVPWGLIDPFVVVHAVEDIEPGAYRYWAATHALERVAAGTLRRQSAFLCLEQSLGGDAAATIFFLAPLDAVLAAGGDRGYRLVNLEAGLAGGRAYLAAYACRFGATGLTFYDDEVVRAFSPAAAGLDAIFVTALGRSATPPAPTT